MAEQQLIKICLQTDNQTKKFYTYGADSWSQLLININKSSNQKEDINKLRKFWIDDENDEIDIDDESSYKMFCLQNPKSKKIFLNSTNESKEHFVHFGVTCDNCEAMPIIGFRYKCLECEDYDLCGNCEKNMNHEQHVMIRLPGDVKNINSGKRHHHHHGKRRHHGSFKKRCPGFGGILETLEDLNLAATMRKSETDHNSSEGSPNREQNNTSPNNAKKYEEHMKTSMDMLSNFHKMFSKILDPLGSDIILEPTKPNESTKQNEQKTPEKAGEKATTPTEQKQTSFDDSSVYPKLDEAAGPSSSNMWEIVNKEKSPSPDLMECEVVVETAKQAQEQVAPQPIVVEHQIYHPKPHINDAVIAMMTMGFSNDGAWLTSLLESVNGDISKALDLMRPLK